MTTSPISLERVADAERCAADRASFIAQWPLYEVTGALDALRATEVRRLDERGHIYLDYTGGGLYAEAQVRGHAEFLASGVFGNPHSHNPASTEMTEHVEATRRRVLEFFNAPPDEYTVVFTPNASGALKLVGEAYPFRPGGCFALSADNHNSVNGIREFAAQKNADVVYLSIDPDELRIDRTEATRVLTSSRWSGDKLFAFPAQSNYSGVRHPLDLIASAQEHGWDVLLDCAAYAPTSRLDLAELQPDYACFSFYKMFGYPTGIGALIAKYDELHKLDRPWFAGGTIQIASVRAWDHFMAHGEAAFEDGTVNYLMIPAVADGLDLLDSVGMDTINARVRCLTGWLLGQLQSIRHANGRPLVHVHGPEDNHDRGGTITVNLLDPEGIPFRGARLEQLAGDADISIRTGCFCNPGAGEVAHGLDQDLLQQYFQRPTDMGFQDLVAEIRGQTGKEISAIRISVGLVSTFEDCWQLVRFLERLCDVTHAELGEPDDEVHLRDTA